MSAVTQTGLVSGGVPAATAMATAMTVATAIAIVIVLATPKSTFVPLMSNCWQPGVSEVQQMLI